MQTDVQIDKNDYFTLLMEIEETKQEYKVERRQLMWFLRIVLGVIVIFTMASIAEDYLGSDPYVSVWGGFAIAAAIILSIILLFRFFNVIYYLASLFNDYNGEKFGFQGIDRIKKLRQGSNLLDSLNSLSNPKLILKLLRKPFRN